MEKLKDLLGTRFLHSEMVNELKKVLLDYKELDLADCKFGPLCVSELSNWYGRIKFIDSSNPLQNEILKHNMAAVKTTRPGLYPIRYNFTSDKELVDYLNTEFEVGNVYNMTVIPSDVPPIRAYSVAILLQLSHPEIMIDCGDKLANIFKQVRIDWLLGNPKPKSAYNEISGKGLIRREVVNGQVYVPGEGMIDEDIYKNEYLCLPAEFGSVNLMKDPEWEKVIITAIKSVQSTNVRTLRMKDLIESWK